MLSVLAYIMNWLSECCKDIFQLKHFHEEVSKLLLRLRFLNEEIQEERCVIWRWTIKKLKNYDSINSHAVWHDRIIHPVHSRSKITPWKYLPVEHLLPQRPVTDEYQEHCQSYLLHPEKQFLQLQKMGLKMTLLLKRSKNLQNIIKFERAAICSTSSLQKRAILSNYGQKQNYKIHFELFSGLFCLI